MITDDFKPKVICKYDNTFWMHLAREFAITFSLSFVDEPLAIGSALSFNFAWEWQDGLRNDGFNVLDFTAGLIGTGLGIFIRRLL